MAQLLAVVDEAHIIDYTGPLLTKGEAALKKLKTHKIVTNNQTVITHDDNQECPVAYLHYSDMQMVEKSEEEEQEGQQIIAALIHSR